jgi:predicted GNAT family acetyltransferase
MISLFFDTSETKRYNLKTKGQKAAYIANMAFEGGYLQYNHNLVNPSQGSKSPFFFFVLLISP